MSTDKELAEAVRMIEELALAESRRKLEIQYAKPYPHVGGPYPWQVEFHAAGMDNRERAILAANRSGKTRSAAAEVAIHLTGLYPKWWTGRRIGRPVRGIAAEPTNELCRDIAQHELFGDVVPDEGGNRSLSGTGWVPHRCIGEYGFRQCGVPNVIDTVKVKHASGGWSEISFKSYEQGAVKYQGTSWDFAWLDEEPETEAWTIFSESLTRLVDVGGMMMFTRTPLFGHSDIIRHFLARGPGVWYRNVTWDDALHLTPENKLQLMSSYAEHERDARTKGVPMLGSGAVYNVPQDLYTCDPFEIPSHFRRIVGIDFGIDHPAAAAWIAHDPDTDIIYVYDCYKMAGKVAAYHAQAINARGTWIPVSWPHDGATRDKGGGEALADQYRALGVNMLGFSARLDDHKGGGQSRAPTTEDILQRMNTGQFKVFRHLSELLEEMRMLHRKNGVIVAVNDDAESAVRYACMMLRFAMTKGSATSPRVSTAPAYDPFAQFAMR